MTMINYTLGGRTGKPITMYNLIGRTQKQQIALDAKLKKRGCLWGKIDILHQFIFTRKELNAIKRAKLLIKNHRAKLYKFSGMVEYNKYLLEYNKYL